MIPGSADYAVLTEGAGYALFPGWKETTTVWNGFPTGQLDAVTISVSGAPSPPLLSSISLASMWDSCRTERLSLGELQGPLSARRELQDMPYNHLGGGYSIVSSTFLMTSLPSSSSTSANPTSIDEEIPPPVVILPSVTTRLGMTIAPADLIRPSEA